METVLPFFRILRGNKFFHRQCNRTCVLPGPTAVAVDSTDNSKREHSHISNQVKAGVRIWTEETRRNGDIEKIILTFGDMIRYIRGSTDPGRMAARKGERE